jgi:GTP-binding protein Era
MLNQLLRRKVAIVSDHPQTTRNAIRGVLTTEEAQFVFVDTPGLHKPRSQLGRRLNNVVRSTLPDVDVIVFVVDVGVGVGVGGGDEYIAAELRDISVPVVLAMNKVDLTTPESMAGQEPRVEALGDWPRVPISARIGAGLPELLRVIAERLPEGPMLYPPDAVTDQPQHVLIAEIVREKLLELLSEELPHSIAVVVDHIETDADGVLNANVVIYVERDSQKGIVIGKGGRLLKQAGTRARREIEAALGTKVFLTQHVKVARDWQDTEGMAERFGYAT